MEAEWKLSKLLMEALKFQRFCRILSKFCEASFLDYKLLLRARDELLIELYSKASYHFLGPFGQGLGSIKSSRKA